MICSSCGAENRKKVSFCEECGNSLNDLKATSTAAKSAQTAGGNDSITLLTWKPWRFLFKKAYGSLALDNGHLDYVIRPQFTHPVLGIIAKIMYWGFNPLSLFWLTGHSALKNLNAIAVWRINWIVWDMHFLFVFSSGFTGLYAVSAEQIHSVREFVAAAKEASANAKYVTKG